MIFSFSSQYLFWCLIVEHVYVEIQSLNQLGSIWFFRQVAGAKHLTEVGLFLDGMFLTSEDRPVLLECLGITTN